MAGLQVATQQTAYAAEWDGFTGGSLYLNDDTCAMVGGPVSENVDKELKRGKNVVNISGEGRAEGPGPNDVVDMEGRARIVSFVDTAGQYIKGIRVNTNGKLDVRPRAGHNCDPDANLDGGVIAQYRVKHRGWIKMNGSASGGVGVLASVVHAENINESATLNMGRSIFFRAGSNGNVSTTVSPGLMQLFLTVSYTDEDAFGGGGIILRGKAPGDAKANVNLKVIREGSAKGSAKGSGKKYAKPASQRKCSAGKLPITLTKKAKKAKKIEVYAGKKKVASYKGKPGKKKVKLPKKAATVKVVSKLKSGGKATVKRSYHACL